MYNKSERVITLLSLTGGIAEELNGTMYEQDKYAVLADSEKKEFKGNYFEMMLIQAGGETVGTVSLYAHGEQIISLGPEIKPEHRRHGYAYEGMKLALAYAKEQGYTLAVARVREENAASHALHRKLGYEWDGIWKFYIKTL